MRIQIMAVAFLVAVTLAAVPYSHAIPPFSRLYGTSCATCHLDFPKLNDFGKAFKDAGFKFPKNDEDFIKIPPVMLGAPAQKEMWPNKAIYPGTLPGIPQLGLRFNQYFQYTGKSANNYTEAPVGPAGTLQGPNVPRTDFEPGFFSIFTAGNFGDGIAWWVDDDISVSGANANGSLGDAYLRFVNIGRFFKLPADALTLKVGQFELDLPFTQARSINISPYDIYFEANISNVINPVSGQPFVNNISSLQDVGHGFEMSGGHSYGGYHYSLAVVDQNTSGTTSTATNVPSPTGGQSNAPGVGFFSDSNFKDLYGRLSYRFNLEKDPASRKEIQAAGATGPRDHTYLTVGTFGFYGRSAQRFSGFASDGVTPAVITAHEPFYRVGGDFSFNYRTFNLFGLYMYGHDQDLLLNSGFTGFMPGPQAKFNGGFLEADYLMLPWLMGIMRWDRVQSSADFLNGLNGTNSSNFYSPAGSTRDRITPGVQFLIRANIKASFEYQYRPQQTVMYNANGQAVNPFRTNTATGGLEFVY